MKKILAIKFLAISCLLIILVFFLPVKFAVKEEDLKHEDKEYYIVQQTDYYDEWYISKSNKSIMYFKGNTFTDKFGIGILGSRKAYGQGVPCVQNEFAIYGEFVDYNKENGMYTFDVKKWDIIYPIERDNFYSLIASDKYLTIFDYLEKFFGEYLEP